jgi:hypothetical protein
VRAIVLFACVYALVRLGPHAVTGRYQLICYDTSRAPVAEFPGPGECIEATGTNEAWRYCTCSAERNPYTKYYYRLTAPIGLLAAILALRVGTRPSHRPRVAFIRRGRPFAVAPIFASACYGLLMLGQLRYGWHIWVHWTAIAISVVLIAYLGELIVVLPAFFGLRTRPIVLDATMPVAGVFGAFLVAEVFGFPPMYFGAWSARFTEVAHAVSIVLAFSTVAVARWTLWPRDPRPSAEQRKRRSILAVVMLAWMVAGVVHPALSVFWGPPENVERYLLTQTPLGTSETAVGTWLTTMGVNAQLNRVHVRPKPLGDYPLTAVGGESFIHAPIVSYRLVFRSWVEVFYIFGADDRLVDLRVRRSTDSL